MLWSELCPLEPFCSGFAKSPGTAALENTSPCQGGLRSRQLLSANLTAHVGSMSILNGIPVVTCTDLPFSPHTGHHHDLPFIASHDLSCLPLFLHLTCQYLPEGKYLVTEIAAQLFSLTPFCPWLQCCQREIEKYPNLVILLPSLMLLRRPQGSS